MVVLLAAKGAEFVGCGWHLFRAAEFGASCTLAAGVDSASQRPPVRATSCASVAGLGRHG
jgi:hypothetical protein